MHDEVRSDSQRTKTIKKRRKVKEETSGERGPSSMIRSLPEELEQGMERGEERTERRDKKDIIDNPESHERDEEVQAVLFQAVGESESVGGGGCDLSVL